MKSIGILFSESRLIAKTLNRIVLEPDLVDLRDWRSEAKLLCSEGGSCLSSTTLLVKGKSVPTYGIDGRCYGILLNAEDCYIYDVNATDANTNRTDKLQKRSERKGINLLTSNLDGIKTLDELSREIKEGKDGHINEVLLDAWKDACVGLFVRQINLQGASPVTLKHYYQSLLEIRLIQKYLIQSFKFPETFKIYQYNEREGKLFTFPSDEELKIYARMYGLHEKVYPELFRLLADEYKFAPLKTPLSVEQYLAAYQSKIKIDTIFDKIIGKLTEVFEPFDAREVNEKSILSEPVDDIIGVSEYTIQEVIGSCMKQSSFVSLSTASFFYYSADEENKLAILTQEESTVTIADSANFAD